MQLEKQLRVSQLALLLEQKNIAAAEPMTRRIRARPRAIQMRSRRPVRGHTRTPTMMPRALIRVAVLPRDLQGTRLFFVLIRNVFNYL